MTMYMGPWRRSWLTGLMWRAVCFTGWHAWAMRALLVLGNAAQGLVIGFIIGLAATIIGVGATAETGPGAMLAGALGMKLTEALMGIGAALGAVAGATIAYLASCNPCGMCIEIAYHMVFGRPFPLLPVVILPSTIDCTMIPPGCP